jgi:hypothetical protein
MRNLTKRIHALEQRLAGEPPATLIMPDGRMENSAATTFPSCFRGPAAVSRRRHWNCALRAWVPLSRAVAIFWNWRGRF